MDIKAVQDFYPDELSYCYGCGRLNEHGHQIKSYWDGGRDGCAFYPGAFSYCNSRLRLWRLDCIFNRLSWNRFGSSCFVPCREKRSGQ